MKNLSFFGHGVRDGKRSLSFHKFLGLETKKKRQVLALK